MPKKSNKLYRDTMKEQLKKLQKENPEITLISADGSPRSNRDILEKYFHVLLVTKEEHQRLNASGLR